MGRWSLIDCKNEVSKGENFNERDSDSGMIKYARNERWKQLKPFNVNLYDYGYRNCNNRDEDDDDDKDTYDFLEDNKYHSTSTWGNDIDFGSPKKIQEEMHDWPEKAERKGWNERDDDGVPSNYASGSYLPQVESKSSQKSTSRKKRVCKFCAMAKTNGSSSSCPLHLPAIQSRYMRVLEDKVRNALTIYLFRNGDYHRITPTMLHIPKFRMRSMDDIMQLIDKSIRFPVGYAYALYSLVGDVVDDPKELEPYETYVVVNNCKRHFIPMEYGTKKPAAIYLTRTRPRKYAFASFTTCQFGT